MYFLYYDNFNDRARSGMFSQDPLEFQDPPEMYASPWILPPLVHNMSKAVGVLDSVPSGPQHVKGCGCAGFCPQWSTTCQRLWVCWILSPVSFTEQNIGLIIKTESRVEQLSTGYLSPQIVKKAPDTYLTSQDIKYTNTRANE